MLTCCGTCICSRPRGRYLSGECTLPVDLTSSVHGKHMANGNIAMVFRWESDSRITKPFLLPFTQSCLASDLKAFQVFVCNRTLPRPVTRTLKAGKRRLQKKMYQYGSFDSPIVKFITIVIRCNDVQEEDVLSFCIKTAQSELHLGKHLPERKQHLRFFTRMQI